MELINLVSSDNYTDIPESIADHFCKQLTAFQRTIDARGNDLGFPSQQELNMQTKMLANIVKIKKHNTLDYLDIAMKRFLKFIASFDKQMSRNVKDLYMEFLGLTPSEDDNTEMQDGHEPAMSTSESPDDVNITQYDYMDNERQLGNYTSGDERTTTLFQGRQVNKYWLEYNLTQFTLHASERRFITEDNFRYIPAHRHKTEEQIRQHFRGKIK